MGNKLYALGGGIGALVKLPRQKFYREYRRRVVFKLRVGIVKLRLRKYGFYRVVKQFLCDVFRVVSVDYAKLRDRVDLKKTLYIGEQGFSLVCKLFLFFGKYAVYHYFLSFALSARAPMSCR